jgi:hypothetical protein
MTKTKGKKEEKTLLTNGLMPLVRKDIEMAYRQARLGHKRAWLMRIESVAERVAKYTLDNEISVKKTLRL